MHNISPVSLLSEKEQKAIADLAAKQDISPEGVLRQALRLYQLVQTRMDEGYSMQFRDENDQKYPDLRKLSD